MYIKFSINIIFSFNSFRSKMAVHDSIEPGTIAFEMTYSKKKFVNARRRSTGILESIIRRTLTMMIGRMFLSRRQP